MAVDLHVWRLIRDLRVTGAVLSAGYPDLLVKREDLGVADEFAVIHHDSDEIAKHHGWRHPVYDSRKVFAGMGLELTTIDVERREGSELLCDLNIGPPPRLGAYTLVLDPGTIEHCFNIPQALMTLADAVAEGGYIIHSTPCTMVNHGYWNANPIVFCDFYSLNGFDVRHICLRADGEIYPLPEPTMRLLGVPQESVVLCVARRVSVQVLKFPHQRC